MPQWRQRTDLMDPASVYVRYIGETMLPNVRRVWLCVYDCQLVSCYDKVSYLGRL